MIKVFAQTDVGRVRKGNEDSFLVVDTTSETSEELSEIREFSPKNNSVTLMVSDGMGGAAAGEVASNLAVSTAMEEMQFNAAPSDKEYIDTMLRALNRSNQVISDYAREHPEMRGMGATATLAGILRNRIFIGQIGDSRAYLIRKNQIKQVTKDQSWVNQLVESGKLTPEEAETHPRRNVILQALGNQPDLKVAVTALEAFRGDYLLLCSDGLSGLVKKEEMLKIVQQASDLKSACRDLVALANQRGGHDNVTIVLANLNDRKLNNAPGSGDIQVKTLSDFSKPALSASLADLNSDRKNTLLTVGLLAMGVLTSLMLWLYWSKRNVKQLAKASERFESMKMNYQAFLAANLVKLELVPGSQAVIVDTALIKDWFAKTTTALGQNEGALANTYCDSSDAALMRWQETVIARLNAFNGSKKLQETSIRNIWQRQLPDVIGLGRQVNQKIDTLSAGDLHKLQAETFTDARSFLVDRLSAAYISARAGLVIKAGDKTRFAGDIEQSNTLFQIASEQLLQMEPLIVQDGMRKAAEAMRGLGKVKNQLQAAK